MITLAGFAIMVCELISIHFLFKKYFGRSKDISVEEFLMIASLPDIVKFSIHQRNGFFALCLMTMGRLFQ